MTSPGLISSYQGKLESPGQLLYTRSPQKTEHDLQLVYFIISLERGLLDEQLEENAPVSNKPCISAPRWCERSEAGLTQRSTGPPQVRTPWHLAAIQAGDTKA
jgi:hypothetical protein